MTAPAFDLSRYDAFVFDLDGNVWLGTTPIPGAAEFLDRCRAQGATVTFATNATAHLPATLHAQLTEVGLARPGETVVTSGSVMIRTLRASGATHIAGVIPPPLVAAMRAAGLEVSSSNDVDVEQFGPVGRERALVGAASRLATIGEIERLGRLAMAGHRLYLSSKEPGFPITGGIEPGGGVLLAALRTMYDVEVTVVGKPSPFYADTVLDAVGGPGRSILMVGDSQRADIGIADLLQVDSVLLKGHSVAPIVRDLPAPTYVAATLADLPTPHRWN
jgi:HAD superfamily hydrolase (TIGR01450 family)